MVDSRKFSWYIDSFSQNEIKLKLEFEKPDMISSYGKDVLVMEVLQPKVFLVRDYPDYFNDYFWNTDSFFEKRNLPK